MGLFCIGVIVGLLLAFNISYHLYTNNKKVPVLIGTEETKSNTPLKTYTIINSDGEKEYIMSSKSIAELLSELNYAAIKQCTS